MWITSKVDYCTGFISFQCKTIPNFHPILYHLCVSVNDLFSQISSLDHGLHWFPAISLAFNVVFFVCLFLQFMPLVLQVAQAYYFPCQVIQITEITFLFSSCAVNVINQILAKSKFWILYHEICISCSVAYSQKPSNLKRKIIPHDLCN